MSFYIVAMLFIMFDIEIIFIYPYAVNRAELGAFAFWEMLAFSVVFFLAFVYVVARGALDWGPVAKARRLVDGVSATRTSSSTMYASMRHGTSALDTHVALSGSRTSDPRHASHSYATRQSIESATQTRSATLAINQ